MKRMVYTLSIVALFFFISGCADKKRASSEYMPELGFSDYLKVKGGIYICWNDMVILDDNVYRIQGGSYKKTNENLCNFFNITELTENGSYGVKQYNNLIITVNDNKDKFLIYDMDSMKTYSYDMYNAGGIASYTWFVCNGTIYYEVQTDENELERMIVSMDILTGENKKIYSLSERELSNNMNLAYSFMLRRDEAILLPIYNSNTEMMEYRKINSDTNWLVEEKMWETDKYIYLYSMQYNEKGAFLFGEFYRTKGGRDTEIICVRDNGEAVISNILSLYGLIMTDEGYYLCGNSKDPYMMVDAKVDDWITVIDSITFYDYEGKMIKRYYLDNEEFRQKGYKLENIIYAGNKMIIFYCNEENGDLQIKHFPLIEEKK